MASPTRLARPRVALPMALGAVALSALGGCQIKNNTASDNLILGKQLFVKDRCASCHTLAHVGSKAMVGPNLDAAFAQALQDGVGRSTIRGIVRAQIANPNRTGVMPANLATGAAADDIAAYVASVVDVPGQDSGLLATAIQTTGKPAAEAHGVLQIDADPNGQLLYTAKKASATAGPVTIRMKNASGVPHNIAIQGPGAKGAGPIVSGGGVSQFHVTLKPGTYTYFCQVDSHRAAGMFGTLVVK